MAKARFKYNRIMPLEAAIFNLRLEVDQAPDFLVKAQGEAAQRAWAYMRDANGGNALSKLARYETSLLREYDRSREELEKMQKARQARELQTEPNSPVTRSTVRRSSTNPKPSTQNPEPVPVQPMTGATKSRAKIVSK